MEIYKKVKDIDFGKHISGRFDLIVCDDKEYGENLSEVEVEKRVAYINKHLIPALLKGGLLYFGSFRLNHKSTF